MIKRVLGTALLTSILAACAGITLMQDSLSKLDQSTHDLATVQESYWTDLQAADCQYQSLESVARYYAAPATSGVPLSSTCKATILTDDQVELRKNLTGALVLYVDKLQAIGTDDSDKNLTSNSESLAAAIKKAAPSVNANATGVEAALIAISELALDQRRFGDIKSAAIAMNPSISSIVQTLKNENQLFLEGYKTKSGGSEIAIRTILAAESPRNAPSLSDLLQARTLFEASSNSIDEARVKKLNAALDALASANEALAKSSTGGLRASINDLTVRVRSARSIKSDLAN